MSTPLSTRIAGYFGALFLAAVAVLYALWYFGLPLIGLSGAGGVQIAEVTRTLEHEADYQRAVFQSTIAERRGDLLVIAENRVIAKQLQDQDPNLEKDFERVSERLHRAYPDRYLDLMIVDPVTGHIRASSDKNNVGRLFDQQSLIARARSPGIKELVEPVPSRQGTTVAIVRQMDAPGADGYPDNALVGILIATVDPQALFANGLMAATERASATGVSTLFDEQGRPLRTTVATQADISNAVFNPLVAPGFEGTLQGTNAQGQPTIQVYRHLRLGGALGWTLVHELSTDIALAGLQENATRLALSGLLLTVIALVVIALAAQRLTRPLRGMADIARQLGQGDFSARMQLQPKHPREISLLSTAFNDMALNMEQGHNLLESAVATRTRELAQERDRAQGYLNIVGVMLLALNAQGRITMVNRAGARLLGYPIEVFPGMDWFENFLPANERDAVRRVFEGVMRSETWAEHHEHSIVNATGELRLMAWNNVVVRNESGAAIGILSSAEDITERRQTETELRIAAIAFESQEGMFVTNAHWDILRVNQAFTQITGFTAQEALGRQPKDLLGSARQDDEFYEALTHSIAQSGTWQGEVWDRHKNGNLYPAWLIITAVKGPDGQVSNYVASVTDITERKATEEEIRNLAFYDPLTGLPNRRLLMNRLEQALVSAARHGQLGALLFVDLDDFKTLNDTLGHDKGDQLLQQVGTRLQSCMREVDTVARLGGDEFVVLLEDLSDDSLHAASYAETVAEKILAALNEDYQIAGLRHHSSPSIGITLLGEKPEGIEEPLKRADMAMYQAKAAGRNTVRFFDPQTQSLIQSRLENETALRHALTDNQFILHYQAQMTAQGTISGAEALVRWVHPQRGMVSPAEFIPLAEETGAILPLGRWVLEQACTQLLRWAADPKLAQLSLSVNVSARQFHDRYFVDEVLEVLERSGANPQRLKLELTESLLVRNVEDMIVKMNTLKARGVGFSLDDFGTGYSSLSYLKRLPLDQLKIDQSFVRDILVDPNDAAIAQMVVALANSMGLTVIAEGVETEAQRDALAHLGCLTYQGYLFGRPVPMAKFEDYVRSV